MKIKTEIIEMHYRHPFRIARVAQANRSTRTVRVEIEHEGISGQGAGTPSEYYYGETPDAVADAAAGAAQLLGHDLFHLEEITRRIDEALPRHPATRAALDIALHDWVGKAMGVPLYRLLGLDPARAVLTDFTIGIDSPEVMVEKIREVEEFPILKIKMGLPGDMEALATIREHSDAVIRIDANCGWTVEETIEKMHRLKELGVEYVEQPIPAGNPEGLRRIREHGVLPVIVDEDSVTLADLPALVGCVEGINIKLMKCGGVREAVRMIHFARAHGMKVMLGCMSESALSLTAAAHLAPLVDYADLDGCLLLRDDPFEGMRVKAGAIQLPTIPGIGVIRRPGHVL